MVKYLVQTTSSVHLNHRVIGAICKYSSDEHMCLRSLVPHSEWRGRRTAKNRQKPRFFLWLGAKGPFSTGL